MLGPILRRIFITFFQLLYFFAWVRLVWWRLVMLDPIKLLSLTRIGDEFFFSWRTWEFILPPVYLCLSLLSSWKLLRTNGDEILLALTCLHCIKQILPSFFPGFTFLLNVLIFLHRFSWVWNEMSLLFFIDFIFYK